MQNKIKLLLSTILLITLTSFLILPTKSNLPKPPSPKALQQKIQVAILLDVSSSMDGLISQAKTQLWNMVNTLGKVKCGNDLPPKIEIALYEYGRSTNDAKQGYVKQIKSFTNSLDSISLALFGLTTNGGDEYCGTVIHTSLNELPWDTKTENYKVIFIAGNEDFLQGNIQYTKACDIAKQKGVVVNTIYCGDKQQGIREHWDLQTECGNGTYTNIDANAKEPEIPTPYDSMIYACNTKLNGTYSVYNAIEGRVAGLQIQMDDKNFKESFNAGAARVRAKAQVAVYDNSSWDLVDAQRKDSNFIKKLDRKILPDSLKTKTIKELEEITNNNRKTRDSINTKILEYSKLREEYIKNNKPKSGIVTLETEVEKIIKEQVKKANMKVVD